MYTTMLQAKLHRVCVTETLLDYEGSCGIDETLLRASSIRAFQHIDIYNVSNGQRFSTYAITAGQGQITLNGAAARRAAVGDLLIICAYSIFMPEELQTYRPVIVLVDERNQPTRVNEPGVVRD